MIHLRVNTNSSTSNDSGSKKSLTSSSAHSVVVASAPVAPATSSSSYHHYLKNNVYRKKRSSYKQSYYYYLHLFTKITIIIALVVWILSQLMFIYYSHFSTTTSSRNGTNIAIGTNNPKNNNNNNNIDDEPSTYYLSMYGQHRFQSSFNSLPKWLQEYFIWHNRQTTIYYSSTINSNDVNSTIIPTVKYAVLTCLPKDTLCGGLSDRLRPLPFYLLIAKYSQRLLCIHWEKPFALQEYLQPVYNDNNDSIIHTIDWRCPNDIKDYYDLNYTFDQQPNVPVHAFGYCKKEDTELSFASCIERSLSTLNNNDQAKGYKYITLDLATHSNDCINNANLLAQRHSYYSVEGMMMPDLVRWQYPEMMEHIFRVMFEPVPVLAKRINSTMTKLGLVENQYITTHVRARYPAGYIMKYIAGNSRNQTFDKDGGLKFEGKLKDWIVSIVKNAIICGHLLSPDLNKIFFVSDHNDATEYALSNDIFVGDKKEIVRAIGINRNEEPLHMDGNHNQHANVADFYSVFEDLLIMGGSKCVSHGIGSFGSFGAGLSGNRCRAIHRKYNAQPVKCPNGMADRNLVKILESEMLFGDKQNGGQQ